MAVSQPPKLDSNLYVKDSPATLIPDLLMPPRNPQAEERIRRAEARVEAGKRLSRLGDEDGARREFDLAIDALLSSRERVTDRRLEEKFVQLVDEIYRYDVERLSAGATEQEPGFDKSPLEEIIEMTFPIDPSLRAKVKDEVSATVSQLPLEENDAVLSYINYFSSARGRKTLVTGLQRAGRYRPLIQRILDEEGVPQELIYLAQAESGFLPRAVSRKQACGMWQFIQARGREYGLNQNSTTDDRLDPERATRAAARHLRDLYQQFGDWYLAMAAYNCGPGCVDRAVERTGYADFWELRKRNAIPRETANYIPIILAMTIMHKNAKDYGLEGIETDPPLEYDTIRMTSSTNLALIADLSSRTVVEIRELNPALLKNVAPSGYALRIPKGSGAAVQASLESIPAERRASWRVHRVNTGDTLQAIAKQYNTAPGSITAANSEIAGLDEALEAGDLLVIPAAAVTPKAAPRKSNKGRSTTKRSSTRRRSS